MNHCFFTAQVDSIEDTVQQQLQRVAAGKASELSEAEVKNLTKRKLLAVRTWTAYRLARGPKFALERKKQHTDLTVEMLRECAPHHIALLHLMLAELCHVQCVSIAKLGESFNR